MKTPIAVAAIVVYGDKVLIGKKVKANHFLSGQWHLPGGKPEPGEKPEAAIVREIKEEAGIDIEVVRFLCQNRNSGGYAVWWFLCQAKNDRLKPGDDLAEAKFVGKKETFSICSQTAIEGWPKEAVEFLRK